MGIGGVGLDGLDRSRVGLFAGALAVRLGLIAILTVFFPFPLERWTAMRDGARYLATAHSIATGSTLADPTLPATLPGYPLSILLFGPLMHPGLAGVLVNVLGAAIAVVLFDMAFKRRRLSWVLAVFPPSWILYTSMVMSEGLFLALVLGAVVCLLRERPGLAGLLLSVAAVVRVQALIPLAAALVATLARGDTRGAVHLAAAFVVVPVAWALGSAAIHGDPAVSLIQYPSMWVDGLLAWPLVSIVRGALDPGVPLWKTAYVWAHVLATIVGSVLAVRLLRDDRSPLHFLLAVWLVGNTLAQLCLGPVWGFHEYHRFMLPALPPLLLVFARWIPMSARVLGAMALCSVGMSVFALAW